MSSTCTSVSRSRWISRRRVPSCFPRVCFVLFCAFATFIEFLKGHGGNEESRRRVRSMLASFLCGFPALLVDVAFIFAAFCFLCAGLRILKGGTRYFVMGWYYMVLMGWDGKMDGMGIGGIRLGILVPSPWFPFPFPSRKSRLPSTNGAGFGTLPIPSVYHHNYLKCTTPISA